MRTDQFFQFEADFVTSLRCIPMQVRFKLDTCGIKLKLSQWSRFTTYDRQLLIDLSCQTPEEIQNYREHLKRLIFDRTGERATELAIEPNPIWNRLVIPTEIVEKAQELGITIQLQQWANLTSEQRFALVKLSRSNHENKNFLPALKEFDLI
ncbi:nitrate reductase associated protein [Leptolyngbya sp. FACHB-36]|uniref:nitrate reductase associated protein n=1 Tax=Leptolyngbya sp. FACHB-36 TaxID=2692808 RepID=UPI001681B05E|nr:nitrate reductase associated protein [Leptolyngbya sp. FACHB-36]MBD2019877.1 nitrate reductase associated protein [Leptolyngbya sp. FACHB-36]